MKRILFIASGALVIGVMLAAQTNRSAAAGDWPMYSLNHAGTRFSPLTDINAGNVGRLAQAWSVRLTEPAGAGNATAAQPRCGDDPFGGNCSNPEATPIVVDGVMY